MSMPYEVTYIVFQQIHPSKEIYVPVAEAEKFFEDNLGNVCVTKVTGDDKSRWSWAKAWYHRNTYKLSYIGVGPGGYDVAWSFSQ